MNPVENLARYLKTAARRFRLLVCAQGAAAVAATALGLTVALAATLGTQPLTPASVVGCRNILFLGIGAALVLGVIVPLSRLNVRAVARRIEQQHPKFEERLLTFTEQRLCQSSDAFLPFLAADTLEIARGARPSDLVTSDTLFSVALVPLLLAMTLWFLLDGGAGAIGAHARVLWGAAQPFRIAVVTAHKTVRLGSAVPVAAHLEGFRAENASLWLRPGPAGGWKRLPMEAAEGGADFALTLAAVPADAELYAEAEGIRSSVARIQAVDLPRVRQITAHYPDGSESQGDLVANAGSVASLDIETDRPMKDAALVFDEAGSSRLPDTERNRTSAQVTISRDGSYHVGVMYGREPVAVSDEFSIVSIERRPEGKSAGIALPDGIRSDPGKVPPGYEHAVTEYFRRLNQLQHGR